MMFVNGNDLMERMMRLSANCQQCGRPIVFEKGAGLAKDKGIQDNVVMCGQCGAVYTVHLMPSSMTLSENVTQKYFPGAKAPAQAAAPKPESAAPAPPQPAPVQAVPSPVQAPAPAAAPQAALYQAVQQTATAPAGPPPANKFSMAGYLYGISPYKSKGGAIAFWLLGMFGLLNFHNFYLGKVKYGALKLGIYFAMMILAAALGSFSPALGNIVRILMLLLLASNIADLVFIVAGMHGKSGQQAAAGAGYQPHAPQPAPTVQPTFYCFMAQGQGLGGGAGFSVGGGAVGSPQDSAKNLQRGYAPAANMRLVMVQPHEWSPVLERQDMGGGMFTSSFGIGQNRAALQNHLVQRCGVPQATAKAAVGIAESQRIMSVSPQQGWFFVGVPVS